MDIAVVDDEKIWREKICGQLQKYFTHRALHVDQYCSGKELNESHKKYDALMMDVEMPGENGIDEAEYYKGIYTDTEVIILTVHLEFSLDGYRTRALRFIDKTRMEEMLPAALEALELVCDREEELMIRVPEKGTDFIPVGRITFIETDGHGILIHSDGKVIRAMNNISEVESALDSFSFYRSHKSFLVHWKYAEDINDGCVIMRDGSRPYISRRKQAEGRLRLLKYRFRTGRG